MSRLRSALIHLARQKPELRSHLLPLLRTASADPRRPQTWNPLSRILRDGGRTYVDMVEEAWGVPEVAAEKAVTQIMADIDQELRRNPDIEGALGDRWLEAYEDGKLESILTEYVRKFRLTHGK